MRAVPSTLRSMNQQVILERLFRAGAATRAGLAEATGMTRPTSGRIIDSLLAARVIEEAETTDAGRTGRPGQPVRLEARTARFLLIQVGVSHTDIAVLPIGGTPGERWDQSFPTGRSEREWLSNLASVVRPVRERQRTLWAFSISLPGIVDEATGKSLLNPNLHWTESADLGRTLPQQLGIPGVFVQEARALALGHLAATDDRDFLLVDAEEGICASLAIDGAVFLTPFPSTGEIGHTKVVGAELACGCGGRGCLETLISRSALRRAFAATVGRPRVSWPELVASLSESRSVPPWLLQRLDAAATVFGASLNTSGLERVVLTGALAELPDTALDALTDRVRTACLGGRMGRLRVVRAPRRRALGLLRAVFSRLLVPTSDWRVPCGRLPAPSQRPRHAAAR
jgi:predicted NBD/HSP70 family sugar kinase